MHPSSTSESANPGPEARAEGLEVRGELGPAASAVLAPGALDLLEHLERRFRSRRAELLELRRERQARFDAGERPDFLPGTRDVREADWRVAPIPADLLDRRVEITGPTDAKMICNALNSGAQIFMADFEDATSPTWRNLVEGQAHLAAAVRRTLRHVQPGTGKVYELNESTATLIVRPRGWHMPEKNVRLEGRPVSASLFDFALFFFHNARELIARGSGPYFYLPKLESHLEARLWNDVFLEAEARLGLPAGTVRATVLIETLPAAFEMDEILWELREHSAGLNCGRWDYIFSFIKKLRASSEHVLPDRGSVGMDRHFLRSYSRLLVRTCHRRGIHGMGGMAAQIPIKDDEQRNAEALASVRADKRREAEDGHDGTWIAHPGLLAVAREEFDRVLTGPHQIERELPALAVGASDLLRVPRGDVTEAGLRQNLFVGVTYLEAWLSGNGCVPIHGLMEDAATAEIARTQLWQWIHHGARLADGRLVTAELVRNLFHEERLQVQRTVGTERFRAGRFELASALFERLVTTTELEDFLTLAAYEHI